MVALWGMQWSETQFAPAQHPPSAWQAIPVQIGTPVLPVDPATLEGTQTFAVGLQTVPAQQAPPAPQAWPRQAPVVPLEPELEVEVAPWQAPDSQVWPIMQIWQAAPPRPQAATDSLCSHVPLAEQQPLGQLLESQWPQPER
jgi:hypothetical protein